MEELATKATANEYGDIFRIILDIKTALEPLINERYTLKKLINSINVEADREIRLDKFEEDLKTITFKHKSKLKDQQTSIIEMEKKVTEIEQTLARIKEDVHKARPMYKNSTGLSVMEGMKPALSRQASDASSNLFLSNTIKIKEDKKDLI